MPEAAALARIGILGGTFNPPHLGHLVLAQEARLRLGLDRVLLVPAALPPHKAVAGDPGPEVRLALCRAAVAGDEGLGVSAVEVERGGVSYTVDTLRTLRDELPGEALTLIVGADMAAALPGWREPRAILELAELGVAERAGTDSAQVDAALAELGAGARVRRFTMPRIDLSSSAIRARVTAGEPVRHLVPEAVRAEIDARGLYRQGRA